VIVPPVAVAPPPPDGAPPPTAFRVVVLIVGRVTLRIILFYRSMKNLLWLNGRSTAIYFARAGSHARRGHAAFLRSSRLFFLDL
jgi:hypothetical protein